MDLVKGTSHVLCIRCEINGVVLACTDMLLNACVIIMMSKFVYVHPCVCGLFMTAGSLAVTKYSHISVWSHSNMSGQGFIQKNDWWEANTITLGGEVYTEPIGIEQF